MADIQFTLEQRLEKWAWQTYSAIRANFRTQRIYPFEPYTPKSGDGNPFRNSTGSLYNTLYYKVLNAAGGDTGKVDFFFNYYGLFVEAGVGRGQKFAQVDNAQPARHNRRYKEWRGRGDRQSRPAIVMELNFQTRRLSRILAFHYAMSAVRPIYSLASLNSDYRPGEEIEKILSQPEFLK